MLSLDVIDLIDLLTRAVKSGASDVHLKLGQPPVLRLDGDLEPMEGARPLTELDLEEVLDQVTGDLAEAPRPLRRHG